MQASFAFASLAILAAALAGCTADVNVPEGLDVNITVDRIRVNGESTQVRVDAESSSQSTREKRVEVETTNVEVIDITITATVVRGTMPPSNTTGGNNTTTEPSTVILVIIQDKATSEQLAQRQIDVQEGGTSETINVNVKGKDNVVVITQAVEGAADVQVGARGASSSG
jgi:hypothetical protein